MSDVTTSLSDQRPADADAEDWGARDGAWAGIRTQRISVLGQPVSVLHHDGQGDGPPQLLVHGLGSSARSWLEVIGPLSRYGEVVAVDLPGFGETPIPPGGSARVRANAHFIPALLDELGWDRTVLSGSSMGGLIATLAGGWFPERMAALVLVNPALPAPRRDMLRLSKRVLTRILPAATPGLGRLAVEYGFRSKSAEELVEDSLHAALHDVDAVRPALREVLVESAGAVQGEAWRRAALVEAARSLVGMHLERRTVAEAVEAIDVPTLVVWGDADLLVSRRTIDGLLSTRGTWVRHDFVDVGHAPMLECPDDLVDVVGDFYEQVRGSERFAEGR